MSAGKYYWYTPQDLSVPVCKHKRALRESGDREPACCSVRRLQTQSFCINGPE